MAVILGRQKGYTFPYVRYAQAVELDTCVVTAKLWAQRIVPYLEAYCGFPGVNYHVNVIPSVVAGAPQDVFALHVVYLAAQIPLTITL